jgi:hypothetical protein
MGMSGSASQALSRFERATKQPSFHPHATPTQLLDYSVMRDGPPIMWGKSYVGETCTSMNAVELMLSQVDCW